MKKRIKAVVTDLDGTLVNNGKVLTPYTRKVIETLKSKGVLFAINSGRTLNVLLNVCRKWNISDLVDIYIGSNGSEYYETNGYKETSNFLNDKLMLEIYNKIKDIGSACGVFDDENELLIVDRVNDDSKIVSNNSGYQLKVENLNEYLIGKSCSKFFVIDERNVMLKNKDYLLTLLTDKYTGSYSGGRMFEFVDININKSLGIKKICELHNIDRDDIMALGDGDNDIDMLTYAGVSVAMGNSQNNVKEKANYIALDNNEDGFAKFINNYLELNIND